MLLGLLALWQPCEAADFTRPPGDVRIWSPFLASRALRGADGHIFQIGVVAAILASAAERNELRISPAQIAGVDVVQRP